MTTTTHFFQAPGGRWVWNGSQHPDGPSGPQGFPTEQAARQAQQLLVGVFAKSKREQNAVFRQGDELK